MDRQQLQLELRYMAQGRLNQQLKNEDSAKEFALSFLKELSNMSGVDFNTLCNFAQSKETEHVHNCTDTLGYPNSLTMDVYNTIDEMIQQGFTNKVISDKLGIHRNTVSKRRKKFNDNHVN